MQLPNLRRVRELRGLRQRDLAAKAGLNHHTIHGYEHGRGARPNNALKLAQVLDVDLTVLAGEEPTALPKGAAPYPSHLDDDGDRRTIDALDGLCDRLDARLRAGDMTPEEIEDARAFDAFIGPVLQREMRTEADALRRLYPHAYDLAPWAIVGAKASRYIQLTMKLLDQGDELKRAHEEAYRLAS